MLSIVGILVSAAEMGLVFSILAMGYYVTYTVLDFPDLTVEGSLLTGAVLFGISCEWGLPAFLGVILAVVGGALSGILTGVLHVRLGIRPLLSGILTSTLLITVNLVLTGLGVGGNLLGEESTISFGRGSSLHLSPLFSFIPARLGGVSLRDPIISLIFTLVAKLLLDLFFKTKRGLLLRASGSNPTFVTCLGRASGNDRILGLAIGNGMAALSGVLYANLSGNVNQGMGVGAVVVGLASLIIGLTVFRRVRIMSDTTRVILGAILYQAALSVASAIGIPSAYNKMIMAVLFTLALVLGGRSKKARREKENAAA